MTKNKNRKNQIKKKIVKRKKSNKKVVRKNKYKRLHKGKMSIITYSTVTSNLIYGTYGIKLLKPMWLDEKQIEAGRRCIKKYIAKKSNLWIRIYPDLPVTSKPTGVRMGKGKGKPSSWIAKVYAGSIIYEMDILSVKNANKIFKIFKQTWAPYFQLIYVKPIAGSTKSVYKHQS